MRPARPAACDWLCVLEQHGLLRAELRDVSPAAAMRTGAVLLPGGADVQTERDVMRRWSMRSGSVLLSGGAAMQAIRGQLWRRTDMRTRAVLL